MKHRLLILNEGALDSARDSAIGGWVKSDIDLRNIYVMLFDNGSIRVRACKIERPGQENQKGFYFDNIDSESLLRLIIGRSKLVAINIDFENEQKIFYDSVDPYADLDLLVLSEFEKADLEKSASITIAEPFKRAALECIVALIGTNSTHELCVSSLTKMSGYDPGVLCLSEPIREDISAETSLFQLPVGTISKDTSTIVGRSGHLFLYEGSNYLLGQYSEKEYDRNHFKPWRKKIIERKYLADRISANFIQLVIPEKSTVLRDYFPFPLDAPTFSLRYFNHHVQDLPCVFDILPEILASAFRDDFYRHTDTHFTTRGCALVSGLILRRLGLEGMPDIQMGDPRIYRGDLGRRFPGIVEKVDIPADCSFPGQGPSQIYRNLPAAGGHEGINVVWKNADAPVDMKVLAFANSFFGMGDHPFELSWWFARMFKEFHFVWSRNVDEGYVKSFRPDIIVAQTIERFLPLIPDT